MFRMTLLNLFSIYTLLQVFVFFIVWPHEMTSIKDNKTNGRTGAVRLYRAD